MSDPRPNRPTPATAGNPASGQAKPRRGRPSNVAPGETIATPGRPIPTAPIPTEKERQEQRLRERTDAIANSHWLVFICPRGHQNERHRTSPLPEGGVIRCVNCGQPCTRETPPQTAMREHRAATSPLAIAQNLMDRLTDWAQGHLDATTWSKLSDARREEALRNDPTRGDGKNPYSL